jgi:hypothetical protein
VEALDLTENNLIEVSSSIENDESEEKDDEDNIADNGFVRIEDMETLSRPPPRNMATRKAMGECMVMAV